MLSVACLLSLVILLTESLVILLTVSLAILFLSLYISKKNPKLYAFISPYKKNEKLNPYNKLDWKRLSANKGIFKLI